MFFVSKLFTFVVLSPLILVILGGLSLFWQKQPRRALPLLIFTLVLLFLLSSQPVCNFLLNPLENKYSLNKRQLPLADVYIVLGGGIIDRAQAHTPYERLPLASLKRCLETTYWYKRYPHPIIVCGGTPLRNGDSEALYMQQALIELGIPKNKIYLEGLSRNTYENIVNAKTIMRRHHWKKAMLVTSAFHMPRGMQEVHRVGLNASPLPCDYRMNQPQKLSFDGLFPAYSILMDSHTALKEYIGSIYYHLRY